MSICLEKIQTLATDLPLITFYDLPENEQEERKEDYEGIEDSFFFFCRDHYYDLNDFAAFNTPWTGKAPQYAINWRAQAYLACSAWDAMYIKLSECGESVTVGRMTW